MIKSAGTYVTYSRSTTTVDEMMIMAMMNVQEMRNNKWRIYKSTKQQPKHVVQRTQNNDRHSRDPATRSPDFAELKPPRAGLTNVLRRNSSKCFYLLYCNLLATSVRSKQSLEETFLHRRSDFGLVCRRDRLDRHRLLEVVGVWHRYLIDSGWSLPNKHLALPSAYSVDHYWRRWLLWSKRHIFRLERG